MLLNLQFKMEMSQTDSANTPKSYTLNMFKDFVPMCVVSESNQGKDMLTCLCSGGSKANSVHFDGFYITS